MLIHEMTMGQTDTIGGLRYAYPPDAPRPVLIPEHVVLFSERDGTKTLSDALHVRNNEGLFACYLIHGSWSSHKIGV